MSLRFGLLALLGSLAMLNGCAREEIQVYQTPKQKSAPAATKVSQLPPGHPTLDSEASKPAPAAAMPMQAETGTEPQPTFQAPPGWQEQPASAMVFKVFSVAGENGVKATISATSLNGDAGGSFANVNRWRGQLGLEPIAPADLDKALQSIDLAGGKASVVDLQGTDLRNNKPARMIVAMVPHGDQTWFYKMLGDDGLVGREKENFLNFVRSVRYP